MDVQRACAAARAVAGRHGIPVAEPRVLGSCNNTIVHLAPRQLVAKVCATSRRPAGAAMLGTELDVARHLVAAGAPIAAPSLELPAEVHRHDEHAITFWRYHAPSGAAPDAAAGGRALAAVHQALDTYPGPLPSFLSRQVRRAGRLIAEPNALPALPPPDRALLAAEHARLTAALEGRDLASRALHGDPHPANFLAARAGCLMIDFESACAGPLEWDLSALSEAAADCFAADPELLALLRRLRSICVVTWCWALRGRSEEVDRAARLHLERLRRLTPRRSSAAAPRRTERPGSTHWRQGPPGRTRRTRTSGPTQQAIERGSCSVPALG
jgi:hypothetical protein